MKRERGKEAREGGKTDGQMGHSFLRAAKKSKKKNRRISEIENIPRKKIIQLEKLISNYCHYAGHLRISEMQ